MFTKQTPTDFIDFGPQDWHQSGPKPSQRRSQRAAFFIFDSCFDFGSFLAPFWTLWGSLLGIKIGPKSILMCLRKLICGNIIHKTTTRGPKTAPRGPKIAPRGTRDPRKRPQEASKTDHDRSKWPQTLPQRPRENPKTAARGDNKKSTTEIMESEHA